MTAGAPAFDRDQWARALGFRLDPFQEAGLDAVDAGSNVLVAAPTGAGKTVVADYAVDRAVAEGRRAFYTTPIKALSNQKFADVTARHGVGRVGLLTGDHSINGDAPMVVMTTEVLRNMVYARSPALEGLGVVILDEVHYLQDAYRGPVWEEVIVHLDESVRLTCLSATVSNTAELAGWIESVRGDTAAVVSERRPVPLHHHYAMFDKWAKELVVLPVLDLASEGRDRPNPEVVSRLAVSDRHPGGGRGGRRRLAAPRRREVVEHLDGRQLLPVIYFIFSRAACSDAARALYEDGLRLTSPEERERIVELADRRVAALADADLSALGYDSFRAALEAGIAPHHAGMVPAFREAVEACFVAGLVRVVFATETLALGINMPARTVVIEKLSKFTGETRRPLSPSEYTQLTGRAGRRGIDPVGHAVVLHSPWVPFEQVTRLVSSRSYRLLSAFRPTYNMAANLVRRHDPGEAHRLLNLSFAQYQADRSVVGLERRLREVEERQVLARAEAECERGDVALVAGRHSRRGPAAQPADLASLRPGTVIALPGKGAGRPGVVISVAERRSGSVRVTAVGRNGRRVQLTPQDFDDAPRRLGQIDLPQPYRPTSKNFQREVSRALKDVGTVADEAELAFEAAPEEAKGVLSCPDLDRHLAAHREAERLEARAVTLRSRIEAETDTFARQFERVLGMLERWGYVEGWSLTTAGDLLARIYHECDLLVAETVRNGLLDDLDPPTTAGLASLLTYERRGPEEGPPPWFPSVEAEQRASHVASLAHELNVAEEAAGLPLTRPPDPGFFAAAHGWASGGSLDDLLDAEDITGGDFVRTFRQLIDLLRQIADRAPERATREAARAAVAAIDRGVVADAARL